MAQTWVALVSRGEAKCCSIASAIGTPQNPTNALEPLSLKEGGMEAEELQ